MIDAVIILNKARHTSSVEVIFFQEMSMAYPGPERPRGLDLVQEYELIIKLHCSYCSIVAR